MKNKKNISVFLSILLVVSCLSLSACSDKTNNESEQNFDEEGNFDDTITLNDVLGQDGVYCLHSDDSVTKADSLSSAHIEDLYIYDNAEPLVIDRSSGDQLIYIGDLVTTYGDMFEMDYSVEKYYWSGTIMDFEDIAEIEGVDINGVCEFAASVELALDDYLSPLGFVAFSHPLGPRYGGEGILASKEKRDYKYGYYEGTTWVEDTDSCYIPYYNTISYGTEETDWDYVFESPIIKGKEGYFTIDLSNTETGLYIGEFDRIDSHFAFEIK